MERKTRFELATLSLARRCSTTEPLPLVHSTISIQRHTVKVGRGFYIGIRSEIARVEGCCPRLRWWTLLAVGRFILNPFGVAQDKNEFRMAVGRFGL